MRVNTACRVANAENPEELCGISTCLMTNSAAPVFPREGLTFLKQLKRNNNREWFLEHRQVYEESVHAPMLQIVRALAGEFERFAPEIAASPKSLFRIYRDTRFSKDKSPYKTHVAASFRVRGLDRHEGAGFYFHIAPTELWVGGGIYRPPAPQLRAVREHIAEHHERLNKIVKARSFRALFGSITGEQSMRMPRGFPAGHPAEQFLRFQDLLAARELAVDDATRPELFPMMVESFEAMHPFVQFLNEPILQRHSMQSRRDQFL